MQAGRKISKWQLHSRVGVYLGQSWAHARSVGLILSLTTGLVSPQYHLKFDDKFETVKHLPTNSLWQSKCHFTKTTATTPSIPARTSHDESSAAYKGAESTMQSAPLPQPLPLAPLGHPSNGDQPNIMDEGPTNDIHLTDSQPAPTDEQQSGLQRSQCICMPSRAFLESLESRFLRHVLQPMTLKITPCMHMLRPA